MLLAGSRVAHLRAPLVVLLCYAWGATEALWGIPLGYGLVLLFAAVILAGLLLDKWAAFLSCAGIVLTVFVITGGYGLEFFHTTHPGGRGIAWWLDQSFGFVLLALAAFLPQQYIIRRLLQSLQESQRNREELDRIFSLSLDLLCTVDMDGHFVKLNPAWQQTCGYDECKLEGQQFLEFVHPDDAEATRRTMGELSSGKKVLSFINRFRCLDGSYRWIEWSFNPYDEGLVYIAARDITERKQAEEELREAEGTMSLVLGTIREHFYYQTPDHRILWANKAAADSVGLKPEELKGRYCFTLWGQAEHECDYCPLRKVMLTEEPYEQEITAPDGRSWAIRGYPVKDEQGRIEAMVTVSTEVTERKRAEAAMRRSEARYRTCFNSARDAVFMIEAGHFIECNPSGLKMFGCRREDMVGQEPSRFSPVQQPDGRDSSEAALEHMHAALSGISKLFEWRYRRLDGTEFDAEVSMNKVDLDGEPFLQAVVRDITERKRAEVTLRESEARLRSIFLAAPVGIGMLADGVIRQANDRLCQMTGYAYEALVGQDTRLLYPTVQDLEYVRQETYRQIREKGRGTVEAQWRRKDGTIIDVFLSSCAAGRQRLVRGHDVYGDGDHGATAVAQAAAGDQRRA